MRNYELSLLLKTDMAESELQTLLGDVMSMLQDAGALLLGQESKGKRPLRTSIKKQQEAELAVLKFTLDPAKLGDVEQNLRTKENILRFMMLSYLPRKARERTLLKTVSAPLIQETTEEQKVEIEDIDKKLEEIFKDDNF
ncbi:MAG: 30S ribosomal protein S6 [bacterium]|nr:30S ribosomal protein S6 [bacterium]